MPATVDQDLYDNRDRRIDQALVPAATVLIGLALASLPARAFMSDRIVDIAVDITRVAGAALLVFALAFWGLRGRQRVAEIHWGPISTRRRCLLRASVIVGYPCLVAIIVIPGSARDGSAFLVVALTAALCIAGAVWATNRRWR